MTGRRLPLGDDMAAKISKLERRLAILERTQQTHAPEHETGGGDEVDGGNIPGIPGGTDGFVPGAGQTPDAIGLPGAIFAYWNPTILNENADPQTDLVTYEIHVIDAATRAGNSAWATSGSTYAGEGVRTRATVRDQNGVALLGDVDYYLKTVPKDEDGSGASSAEFGPIRTNEEGTVTVGMLEAVIVMTKIIELYDTNDVQTVDIDGTTGIITIGPTGTFQLQLGDLTFPIRYWDGSSDVRFYLDDEGNVSIVGRLQFGSSVADPSGFLELAEATITPISRVQASAVAAGSGTSISHSWPVATTAGNLLIAVVQKVGVSAIVTGPAGWVKAAETGPTTIFYYANAPSRSGSEAFTWTGSATSATVSLYEYAGIATASPLDRAHTNNRNSPGMTTSPAVAGPTSITNQADELWFVSIVSVGGDETQSSPTNGFSQVRQTSTGADPDLEHVHGTYEKIVATIGQATMQVTLPATGGTNTWTTVTLTFKGGGVGTPAANKLRVYPKDKAGTTALYAKNDAGVEYELTDRAASIHATRHHQDGADPLPHIRLLGYTEKTTSQTGISALTDLTDLSVTVTVDSGRRIKVSAWIVVVGNDADPGASGEVLIREGTTTLQEIPFNLDANNRPHFVYGFVYLTPTAGAHTYKLSLRRTAGSSNIETQHTATQIGVIQVEDVGV